MQRIRTGLRAAMLEIEVTESVLIGADERVLGVLRAAMLAALFLYVLSLSGALPCLAAGSYAQGELLVKFTPQAISAAGAIHARVGSRVLASYPALNWQRVRLPSTLSISQGMQLYRGQAGVVTTEPNYTVHADLVPNNPDFSLLWGLSKINAPTAWNTTTGSNATVVAVVDTGVNYAHPCLAGNMWVNPGNIPGDTYAQDVHGINALSGSGDPMDDNGHGSHVSGTIGAVGNDAIGVVGVNWQVKIMGLKFLDSTGSGTTADAITCYQYAINMKQHGVNIRVINDSWGGSDFSQALEDVIVQAADAGILSVCAAGNSAANTDVSPQYPSAFPVAGIVAVAASDQNDNPAYFTNYGAKTVHLAAPGVNIYSTYLGTEYATLSGTSMATPHVSGSAALVLAAFPSLSVAGLKALLLASVDPLPQWAGLCVSGGRLDVAKALAGATPPPPPPTAQYQPDLLIGTSLGSYIGGGIYGSIPAQTLSGVVSAGGTLNYYLRIQNNGSAPDTFRVSGLPGSVGWSAIYYDADTGGNNITPAITGGGWNTGQLAAGQYREFRLTVIPGVTPAGSLTVSVKAISLSNTAASDIVAAATTFSVQLSNLLVQASLPSPAKVGSKVTIFAFVHGAVPQFSFSIGVPNNQGVMTWSVLQNYSALANAVWLPSQAGIYTIQVNVRPSGSTANYALQQSLRFQVVN